MTQARLPLSAALALALAIAPLAAPAQSQPTPSARPNQAEKSDDSAIPVPSEGTDISKHDWTSAGQTIHYTATVGNLLINDDKDKPNCSMFYVAYTQDDANANSRPVTFFYNGGPGSATIWLHMGSYSPVRVVTDSPDPSAPPPFQVQTNPSSLIDRSDLVFIDAPMTGFSRVVGKGTPKDFAGVDEDVRAFEKFISRYITLNQRWNSPKFLFGESYGTPRSAALVAALENDGIEFNGVTLLSSILNYGVRADGYDTPYVSYLPSYAAIAYYYKKGKHAGSMADAVEEARQFARGPYAEALFQGDNLPAAQFDSIAAKLADITGLSVQYLKETKLRIDPSRYRKELLRGDDRTLGRYDARFQGWDEDSAGEAPGYDPSNTGPEGAYVGAFHEYLQHELKYMSSETYYVRAPNLGEWNYKHHASGGGQQDQPDTAVDLADAIRKNPRLHVFSANGYFDLATPFFATEFDLSHMMLPASLTANVTFGYYPSGHMVYLNTEAQKLMKADLDRFYTAATKR